MPKQHITHEGVQQINQSIDYGMNFMNKDPSEISKMVV